MTQKEMFNAIPTIQKLVGTRLPIKSSYAIFKLAKEIDSQKEFIIGEEKKLIEKYNGKIDEQGRITFEDPSVYENFSKEYANLNNLEVELTTALPIKIDLNAVSGVNFAPADFLTLEGIINFE